MVNFPKSKMIKAGDITLAAYEQGEGMPVILVHGWPEIAYSWKNQMEPLARAGYRAIALDLKGFGYSDAPQDKSQYDSKSMTQDFVNLLDALNIEKAIFCGHDWGGALVWSMAQLHPNRVDGVIGVCTPHLPPPPVPPLGIIEKRFGPKHYFIQFQEDGVCEKIFSGQEKKFFKLMFRTPAPRAEWKNLVPQIFDLPGRIANGPTPQDEDVIIAMDDLQYYVDAYCHSGFHGGINLYRNIDVNYEIARSLDPVIKTPSLWIGAEDDLFLPPETADEMGKLVPDLEKHVISNCGHWVMWQKPEVLNAYLISWLTRRFPS